MYIYLYILYKYNTVHSVLMLWNPFYASLSVITVHNTLQSFTNDIGFSYFQFQVCLFITLTLLDSNSVLQLGFSFGNAPFPSEVKFTLLNSNTLSGKSTALCSQKRLSFMKGWISLPVGVLYLENDWLAWSSQMN